MALRLPVYMDYHSTTPVDPIVLGEMLPYFNEKYGNAASTSHAYGEEAASAVQAARARIEGLTGVEADEIFFTSGATEAINMSLKGIAQLYGYNKSHIITVVTEHRAVLDTCRFLQKMGCRITYLKVDSTGMIDPDDLQKSIQPDTRLISVMTANNEIGTLNDMASIAGIAARHGVLFHSDVTQAIGKMPLNFPQSGFDLAAFSGHKIYGPKGVGVLYLKKHSRARKIEPLIHGGGHENGYRSGTLNVPAIVGFGAACSLCREVLEDENTRISFLRNRLYDLILAETENVTLNGPDWRNRLAGNLNLSFEGIEGESLILNMPDIAVSSGSACTSASIEPSHVIMALGFGRERAFGAVRFGLGRYTDMDEVEYVATRVNATVKKIRKLGLQ